MNNIYEQAYIDILESESRPTIKLSINNHIFNNVSVSTSSKDIRNGLMWVEQMKDDQGMLFVFDEPGVHNFWMKNTLIPLDVIFLDENKNVISFYSMDVEPQNSGEEIKYEYEKRLKRYSSVKPCKFAIEINYGLWIM